MTWKDDLLSCGIFITAFCVYFFEICLFSLTYFLIKLNLPDFYFLSMFVVFLVPPIIIYKALNKVLV